jgi:hypothetical protein
MSDWPPDTGGDVRATPLRCEPVDHAAQACLTTPVHGAELMRVVERAILEPATAPTR